MPPKRKRGGADMGGIRPSPHRPEQTTLGQLQDGSSPGRGSVRGGRGGFRRSDHRDSTLSAGDDAVSGAVSPTRPNGAAAQPPTPTTAMPLRSAAAALIPEKRPRATLPYVYAILTDERVANWAQSGRQAVVESGVQSRNDEDEIELSTLFQEILRAVMDKRLDAADAGTVVKAVVGSQVSEVPEGDAEARSKAVSTLLSGGFDPRIVFLDTVSVFMETEDTARGNLQLLRGFMVNTGVSATLMRQVLDHEFLMRLGLLRDTFQRMAIRYSTNLLYRQQSYNLLREETEGFSKLVTELYTSSSVAVQDPGFDAARATFEKVKGLIGTFDLDVGRVLDTTLDVFAATIIKQFKFFVKFLRISSWWPRDHSKHPRNSFFGGLPRWAQPELAGVSLTEEEEDALVVLERQKRDVAFWDAARQMHLHAFFQLGAREIADPKLQRLASLAAGVDMNGDGHDIGGDDVDKIAGAGLDDHELHWIKITKTLPPQGNRVAAQILGFKLRFYSSEARGADDILPANLLYLAALLIKIGFISFCDLYPHLWPPDEGMEHVRTKRQEELDEKERRNRPGMSSNALAMAGALPDDMPAPPAAGGINGSAGSAGRHDGAGGAAGSGSGSGSSAGANAASTAGAAGDAPQPPEPLPMKVQIVDHLLLIGAIPESLFILGRFPWIMELYAENLLPLIHRILIRSLHKVGDAARPVPSSESLTECPPKKVADADQSGMPKGSVKRSELPTRRPFRWPFADKLDVSDGQAYRFYFDEWVDNVPVCQSVDDVFTLCHTFLGVSGVSIGQDPELLSTISAIGVKSLHDDASAANRQRWHDLLRRLLVPALSLIPENPSCVDAVWQVLRNYPLRVRYELYTEWYEGPTSRLPAIKKAFDRIRRETRGIMRRIAKDNKSVMGRALAKTALASPGIVFKVALEQLEAYDNIIDVFVSCARYFTDLGYDVLVWSLMSSLGGKQRSRTQETSVLLTSKWLQALSRFSGQVFTSYGNMDVGPVVQYVNAQLFRGNATDLIILKELILSMGGLVSDSDFTDAQIQAMTGGPALRRLTLTGLGDRRYRSQVSAQRLMKALVDTRLAGRLLINLAQYRQSAIYAEEEREAHIKFLATMVDDTHQVLAQYLDLLHSNLGREQFAALVPSIPQLIVDFGLDAGLAFMIGRAGLDLHGAMAMAAAEDGDDVAMKGGGGRTSETGQSTVCALGSLCNISNLWRKQ